MAERMKKAGTVFLTAVLLCSMTACGKKPVNLQIIDEQEAEPEYLSFFASKSMSGTDLGKYWSERFAEVYDQKVYVDFDCAEYYTDEGLSYRELLEKRLDSTLEDDLYIISAEDVLEFGKKGYWMDLGGLDFVNNLSDAALYQSTYNGKVFSVPLTLTAFGFYWNVSMLERYGLSVPKNQEEFWKACEKLKSEGVLPYGANKGYALTVPAMCRGLSKLYGTIDQGERIASLNSGETPISVYMEDGFEFLAEMIERGYLDPDQALKTNPRVEDIQMFREGQCAFICTGMEAVVEDKGQLDFKTEFTGIPLLEDGCVAVYGASSRLCVNPDSAHLETALKFIEMVGTKESLDQSAIFKEMLSSAKDSELQVPSEQQAMFELLQQPGQIPNQDFSLHFNTWENIRNMGREICEGATVQEVCAKLDDLQRTEIESYSEEK